MSNGRPTEYTKSGKRIYAWIVTSSRDEVISMWWSLDEAQTALSKQMSEPPWAITPLVADESVVVERKPKNLLK
jgi:hypothetical protein